MTAGEKRSEILNGIISRQKNIDIAKEFFRKSIHLCSGLIPLLLHFAYWYVIALLSVAVILYTVCEILRLNGINVPVISAVTDAAARKRDENKFVLGPVTLVLGILACALLWKSEPAAIGIYALAFGDGLASLFGKLFGKMKIPLTKGKTSAGSLTCFAAIFISCFLTCKSCSVALAVACAGMLIEVLPLKDFDNILIPVCLGGFSQFLLYAF